MKRLLPLLLLCACAGSLVDHDGITVPPDAGGDGFKPPTQTCLDTCTTAPQGATPLCNGDACTYQCNAGLLKTPLTNPPSCSVPTAIAAGGTHTCAIAGGQVLCWGSNGVNELGIDAVVRTGIPVQVPGLPATAKDIAASTTQTCVHFASEAIWCWGANQPPHAISGIPGTVNAIAAGESHACAATDANVWCWGDNASGQLGDGGASHAAPATVPTVPGAKVLAAGRLHTCAGTGANVYCWGANDASQCGTSASRTSPPTALGVGGFFVAAGEGHTCSAATASGPLNCWGANDSGQIDGSLKDVPKPEGKSSSAGRMAGGLGHTCFVENGVLSCLGLNDKGQLDTGDFTNRPGQPTKTSLTTVASVAAGSHHTCALLLDGSLKCWGANDFGQLGSGTISGSSTSPVDVAGR